MHRLEHRIPPPIVLLCFAALLWLARRALGVAPFLAEARGGAVTAVVVVGVSFDLGGLLSFRRARTTIDPLHPDRASTLVTTGIYRVTRNPMYVGFVCLLSAWALWLENPLLLAGPLLFGLYLNRFQILPEERAMTEKFGESYARYRQRVRRWL